MLLAQALLLNHRGSPWAVKWFLVNEVAVAPRLPSPPLPVAPLVAASSSQALVPSSSGKGSGSDRSDGLALERSIMLATSLLSVATSALMLAKMFSDHQHRR